jgi:hypothetical protein
MSALQYSFIMQRAGLVASLRAMAETRLQEAWVPRRSVVKQFGMTVRVYPRNHYSKRLRYKFKDG